nr:MAG TPA: hypothetical protein [Caudoviricetes sp.]
MRGQEMRRNEMEWRRWAAYGTGTAQTGLVRSGNGIARR